MGQTPTWGLPYPEQSTLITDSAAIMQELAEKIDTALSAVTASDSYTVPGTLIADMTTSGTFTPPPGVTVVHVVVIGGGGKGGGANDVAKTKQGGGGCGGEVKVWRNLPVTGPVEVIVGGSETASAFGPHTAKGGDPVLPVNYYGISRMPDHRGNGGFNNTTLPAQDGVTVNGTYYVGGGGAHNGIRGDASNLPQNPGGVGGGGGGCTWTATPHGADGPKTGKHASSGQAGTGGGGGGGATGGNGFKNPGLGGSGRVMVYTEQPTMRRNAPTPTPDPLIVAAIDDHGTMTGAYAVDAAARNLPHPGVRVIDYPLQPVDTGRTITAPADPDDPAGPTVEVPVLAWPEAGWTWTDTDGWKEPTP